MEQYRYAIEELVADETAIENKRMTQEERDKEFSRQKVCFLWNWLQILIVIRISAKRTKKLHEKMKLICRKPLKNKMFSALNMV